MVEDVARPRQVLPGLSPRHEVHMKSNVAASRVGRPLGALAQGQAAAALQAATPTLASGGPFGTGAVPNPTGADGVVIAFVAVTPKISGTYLAEAVLTTGPNQNGAPQAVRAGIAVTANAPTVGVTTLTPLPGQPDVTAAPGASIVDPVTVEFSRPGVTYVCLVVAQSVAGAFAPLLGTLKVTEVP
jgi:hypothetical protein